MPKIVRQHSPKTYKNHRNAKKFLRQDFAYNCAYCNVSEAERGGARSFHIDHYKPESICKNYLEANVYSNLIYSCGECNELKSDFWPTVFQRFWQQYVINPCVEDPNLHIDKSNFVWAEINVLGFWNIELFDLVSPEKIEEREDKYLLEEQIKAHEIELQRLKLCKSRQSSLKAFVTFGAQITKTERVVDMLKRKLGRKD